MLDEKELNTPTMQSDTPIEEEIKVTEEELKEFIDLSNAEIGTKQSIKFLSAELGVNQRLQSDWWKKMADKYSFDTSQPYHINSETSIIKDGHKV